MLFEQFRMAEAACAKYLEAGKSGDRHTLALPAYDRSSRRVMSSICSMRAASSP
jgi:hypothetical protein